MCVGHEHIPVGGAPFVVVECNPWQRTAEEPFWVGQLLPGHASYDDGRNLKLYELTSSGLDGHAQLSYQPWVKHLSFYVSKLMSL